MPQRKIPQNDLINFIVKVRYCSCQSTEHKRWLAQIKNLANSMYRNYIGYTARGEFRIKGRGEHVFADEVASGDAKEVFPEVIVENENLAAVHSEMEKIKAERAEYERLKLEIDFRAKEQADLAYDEAMQQVADEDVDAFDDFERKEICDPVEVESK